MVVSEFISHSDRKNIYQGGNKMSHKKWTVQSIVLVTLLLLAVVTAQVGSPAALAAPPGSTHHVNDDGDEGDANPGDGVCETAVDNGVCTLRAAIEEANAWTGSNWIYFNSSLTEIRPDSSLPVISDYGYGTAIRGNPTWINGTSAGSAYGLTLASHNNRIQGLIITDFGASGVRVSGNDNFIGTDGDGVNDGSEGNVISGNGGNGVLIQDNATGNRVSGNLIGLTEDGTGEDGNALSGVKIETRDEPSFIGARSNVVGTNGDGTSDVLERNVISGNGEHGVHITGLYSDDNVIAGNYIGTNPAGDAAIPNTLSGVRIDAGMLNRIGTDDTPDEVERNVISGNGEQGVHITGPYADVNKVAGNYIGTNAAGDARLCNLRGVWIADGASSNRIGPGNVISGNTSAGVRITDLDSIDNEVFGNYIGTNAAGDARLYNYYGVAIEQKARNNTIGTNDTPDEMERNVISGNSSSGVYLNNATGNVIAGNYIGTNASGSGDLGNEGHGVEVTNDSDGNTIGGLSSVLANHIAFNDGAGIYVNTGENTSLRGNVIFANDGLGIDLVPDGVTLNDPGDGDTLGGNNLQNYPVLSAATINGSLTAIQGTLNSASSTTYKLDFYVNGSCDPSGYGEGSTYLGAKTVTTDASGDASFTAAFMNFLPAGTYVTATATDPDGNTSEFSQCLALVSIGKPRIIVRPLVLNVTLLSGDTDNHAPGATLASSDIVTRTLTISNTGSSDMVWSLDESPDVRWMNQSLTSGTIAPGSSADVTISFSAADNLGTHITMLRITSNDPDEGTVEVSATLVVEEVSSYIYLPLIVRGYD
jgi:titin